MMRAVLISGLALALAVAAPARADTERLFEAMQLDRLIGQMRDEGIAYGDTLAQEMLPGGPDRLWQQLIARIYDADKMEQAVRTGFTKGFGDADPAPLVAFFESPEGAALVNAELDTREAFLEPDVEDAARDIWRAADPTTRRQKLIAEYVEVNDLLDYNVTGAMNANYQFFVGLDEGGAVEMSQDDILRDVWAQEAETREDTREWLFGFLTMAYDDLPEATISEYVELSRSDAGKALNRALFAGFDGMYAEQSLSLGLAVASRMAAGEEL